MVELSSVFFTEMSKIIELLVTYVAYSELGIQMSTTLVNYKQNYMNKMRRELYTNQGTPPRVSWF